MSMKKFFISLVAIMSSVAVSAMDVSELYSKSAISEYVLFEEFKKAVEGYNKLKKKKSIFTYIDFTRPSNEKRLYVVDMVTGELLHHTYVSHGRNSGGLYATKFSNNLGSNMSSPGYYLTANAYNGSNGYSLRLHGLDKGINDNAYKRAIVVHGAPYADPVTIKRYGRLGRSLGCPVLPPKHNREIIDTIKGGAIVYIHK